MSFTFIDLQLLLSGMTFNTTMIIGCNKENCRQIWFDWNWTPFVNILWGYFNSEMISIVLHSEFLCQWRIFWTIATYFIYLDHRHIILWTFLQSLSSLILHLPPDEEPHRTPLLPPLLCSGLSTAWCKVGQIRLFSIQFSFWTCQQVSPSSQKFECS